MVSNVLECRSQNLIFIGSGIANMLVACSAIRTASQREQTLNVVFIEAASDAGGLFRSHAYESGVQFDHGMHIYYETGDPDLDQLWIDLLPVDDWVFLEGNRKDVAGVFYQGQLRKDSPYIDLRYQSLTRKIRVLFSILSAIIRNSRVGREPSVSDRTAMDYFENRFGRYVYRHYFSPIIERLFAADGSVLSSAATQLLALNRVVLLPENLMRLGIRVGAIAERIAFPNQMRLPPVRRSHERGIYPRTMGMGRVVLRLQQHLLRHGCQFFFNTRVKEVHFDEGVAAELVCDVGETNLQLFECRQSQIFWGAGPAQLKAAMFHDSRASNNRAAESPLKESLRVQVVADCWIRRPNLINPLYYFYCFDESYRTFRVTNYSAYCPGASTDEWDQVCVELWLSDQADLDRASILTTVELVRMGIAASAEDIQVVGVRVLPSGFPRLTEGVIAEIRANAAEIEHCYGTNLHLLGSARDPKVFFLRDVLTDTKRIVWKALQW